MKQASIITKFIFPIIDYFYFPFKKYVPIKTFRYGVCGFSNMVLDYLLYVILFDYVYNQMGYELLGYHIESKYMSYFTVFPITLLTGFLLNRYVVFQDFTRRKRTQMTRYIIVVILSLIINYLQLNFYTNVLGLHPKLSRFICYGPSILFSYFCQVYFTFNGNRKKRDEEEEELFI